MPKIVVTATRTGYYDLVLREPGTIFTIQDEQEFSNTWMQKVTKKAVSDDEAEHVVQTVAKGRASDQSKI